MRRPEPRPPRRSRRSRRRAAPAPAASRATSVPRPPMAMPMCAAFSAGASFTPSPVIATTSPFAFSASTSRSFCSGTTRAKTFDLAQRARAARRRRARPARRRSARRPALRSPICARDARARCAGWSPVIMTTRMPAVGTRDRRRDRRAHRVGEADQAEELERRSRAGSPATRGSRKARPRDRQHAQAVARPGRRLARSTAAAPRCIQMAQIRDRLGRALGGDHVLPPIRRAPDVRHREQLAATAGTRRTSVQSACRCSVPRAARSPAHADRLLHRVERIALAGEDAELDERVELARAAARGSVAGSPDSLARARRRASVMRFCVSVPVLSTHSTVAAPSVSTAGHAARQHARLRDAPGAERRGRPSAPPETPRAGSPSPA